MRCKKITLLGKVSRLTRLLESPHIRKYTKKSLRDFFSNQKGLIMT